MTIINKINKQNKYLKIINNVKIIVKLFTNIKKIIILKLNIIIPNHPHVYSQKKSQKKIIKNDKLIIEK